MLAAVRWQTTRQPGAAHRVRPHRDRLLNRMTESTGDDLHDLAARGEYEGLARRLESGAEVDPFNAVSETPLIRAAENGHADVVELLLAYGAEINVRDEQGNTALLAAAAANN